MGRALGHRSGHAPCSPVNLGSFARSWYIMFHGNTLRNSFSVLVSMIDVGTTVNKNRFCIVLPTPTKLFHETTYMRSLLLKLPPSPRIPEGTLRLPAVKLKRAAQVVISSYCLVRSEWIWLSSFASFVVMRSRTFKVWILLARFFWMSDTRPPLYRVKVGSVAFSDVLMVFLASSTLSWIVRGYCADPTEALILGLAFMESDMLDAMELLLFSDSCRMDPAAASSFVGDTEARNRTTGTHLSILQYREQRVEVSYNAGISACEKGEQWRRALALLSELCASKLEPTVISYSAGISACEKGAQWQRALALLSDMWMAKLEPDAWSSTTLGSARARRASNGSGRFLCSERCGRRSWSPTQL
ncbi:unnamed protein product [Prorocentrum cordatum]|uniref:Uncharacterized protein n=1 Tax=Prorocentrum cordatum TaxID=2364126 RepID=A0ABN9RLQ2_9DINO|nr:unnamed protein product [Polarella glacialis]